MISLCRYRFCSTQTVKMLVRCRTMRRRSASTLFDLVLYRTLLVHVVNVTFYHSYNFSWLNAGSAVFLQSEQWRRWSDAPPCDVWPASTLLDLVPDWIPTRSSGEFDLFNYSYYFILSCSEKSICSKRIVKALIRRRTLRRLICVYTALGVFIYGALLVQWYIWVYYCYTCNFSRFRASQLLLVIQTHSYSPKTNFNDTGFLHRSSNATAVVSLWLLFFFFFFFKRALYMLIVFIYNNNTCFFLLSTNLQGILTLAYLINMYLFIN